MKQSPIHEIEKAIGAVFTLKGDREVVAHYGAPGREYAAARNSCAMFDLYFRARLRVAGGDAAAFLQGVLTNDVASLPVGEGTRAAMLDRLGRMLGEMSVYRLDGWFLLEMAREAHARVGPALDQAIISEDVVLQDVAEPWGLISLQGPETAEILSLLGIGMPDDHRIVSATMGGHPALVAGFRRADVPGIDLFMATEAMADCWNSIAEQGARPAGIEALNLLRIEAGIPWYGIDLDDHVNPLEAGLEDAISYTKGCYVGQEVVSRIHHLGRPAQQLRGIVLEGDVAPEPGASVCEDGTRIGRVTSAAMSPAVGRPIAIVFLRRGHTEPGRKVFVSAGGARVEGETVSLPFPKLEGV